MNYERWHKTLDSFVAAHPEVKRWTTRGQQYLYEAYCLDLDWEWIDANLRNNEYIPLFIHIIHCIEEKLNQTTCSYDYDLQELLQKYRKLLQDEVDDIIKILPSN